MYEWLNEWIYKCMKVWKCECTNDHHRQFYHLFNIFKSFPCHSNDKLVILWTDWHLGSRKKRKGTLSGLTVLATMTIRDPFNFSQNWLFLYNLVFKTFKVVRFRRLFKEYVNQRRSSLLLWKRYHFLPNGVKKLGCALAAWWSQSRNPRASFRWRSTVTNTKVSKLELFALSHDSYQPLNLSRYFTLSTLCPILISAINTNWNWLPLWVL